MANIISFHSKAETRLRSLLKEHKLFEGESLTEACKSLYWVLQDLWNQEVDTSEDIDLLMDYMKVYDPEWWDDHTLDLDELFEE